MPAGPDNRRKRPGARRSELGKLGELKECKAELNRPSAGLRRNQRTKTAHPGGIFLVVTPLLSRVRRAVANRVFLGLIAAAAPLCPAQRTQAIQPQPASLLAWRGLMVERMEFDGVTQDRLEPLPGELPQQPGRPLDPAQVRESLRRLYATGLYQSIEVAGQRSGRGVTLVFSGTPQMFLRRINLEGVDNFRLASVVQGATELQAGAPFFKEDLPDAASRIQQALQDNGFYRGQIASTRVYDAKDALVDLNYLVTAGPAARVGAVSVQGDSGLGGGQFRKDAKLKPDARVNRNTVQHAIRGLRNHYEKENRLAASVSLSSRQYVEPTNRLNFNFQAQQGPIVNIKVEGARIGAGKLRQLVPVYEEGAVDQDLLNEGERNLRAYYQDRGFFDVKVSHRPVVRDAQHVTAVYTVDLGRPHVVDSVRVTGNRYFSDDILLERLSVRRSTLLDPHGLLSQQLVNQDVASIKSLYQSNGFTAVKVTPRITDSDRRKKAGKEAHLNVLYTVEEGAQQRIAHYRIEGASPAQTARFQPELSATTGQPYSPAKLSQDRETVLTYYFSEGYSNADVSLVQQPEPGRPDRIDLTMTITPGDRTFVRSVLVSGLDHTRRSVVDQRILLHPGQALNQSAILETQQKLYDLGLFSEVNTAIENPNGDVPYKSVLLNLTEARRWDIDYGFGLEVQSGTPAEGCLSVADRTLLGVTNSYRCNPNGYFGASPRILFNVSRTNLRGTPQSITLRTNYGTLEQVATLSYQIPQVFRAPSLNLTFSGGYDNSAIISTYEASILSGVLRFTQQQSKASTLIYTFAYRRVAVNPATLQVSLADIPLLSQPERVAGPGVSWVRDTRDVPLDAHHGSLTTADQFIASSDFSSQVNFNRLDVGNSTYYPFDHGQWVFARQTQYGQERAFGNGLQELVPLPERLYAGGSTSLRAFTLDAAGPRDPQTGYPVGGSGEFINSSELRSPAPDLPYVGQSLSFVLFHDMGNVFQDSSQVWRAALRIKQPHSGSCRNLSKVYTAYNTSSTCDFNDFAHALGLGLRYRTPIGPVRADFSYTLNPPVFPVLYDYATEANAASPHVGQSTHFNVFFSIGQTF